MMEKMQLSRQHFVNLARNMRDPRFPNAVPLMRFIFEKPSVQEVFLHLIYWLPKSQRADGAIYKSATELAKQTGYCSRTIERTRKTLETMGFSTYVKKANGAPTNHFRFDVEKFLHFLAEKLKTQVEQLMAWMTNTKSERTQTDDTMSESRQEAEAAQMSETPPDTGRYELGTSVGVNPDKTVASSTVKAKALKADSNGNTTLVSEVQASFYERMKALYRNKRTLAFYQELEAEIIRISALVGASFEEVEGWIDEYGFYWVNNYSAYADRNKAKIRHPLSWVQKALENNYTLDKNWQMISHSMDNTAGKYGYFVNC